VTAREALCAEAATLSSPSASRGSHSGTMVRKAKIAHAIQGYCDFFIERERHPA
jgi:hypothetical protein